MMARASTVFLLSIAAGCVHRKPVDPVPVVPISTCSLMTVKWGMITYPPVAGHCLGPDQVLRSLKRAMARAKQERLTPTQ